jgi:hypothetical protein
MALCSLDYDRKEYAMVFTEVDFQTIKMTVKVSAAQKCGLRDAELKSEAELDQSINVSPAIRDKVNALMNAYRKWVDFHKNIEAQKRWGSLNESEIRQLAQLYESREKARVEFTAILQQ